MRTRTPTLLARFTLLGAGITILIALGFGWLVNRKMVDDALHDAVRQAGHTVTTLVTPHVTADDFAAPTPARIAAWEQRVRRVVGGSDIVRVKVWSTTGQIVYSDDATLIGRRYPLEEQDELREALDGNMASELSGLSKSENTLERGHGRLLEVYVPVVLPAATGVAGAYEVYRDYAPLQARITAIGRVVWGGSFAAFGLLYVALFALVSGASRQITRQQEELQGALMGTIRALATAIDAKDAYTAAHSSRIADYAVAAAERLGLRQNALEEIRLAAYLHDVGKIGIPDRILSKAGALSDAEQREMRRHSLIAWQILEGTPLSGSIKLAVRHNHEYWNGGGYPDGLAGDEIPLSARILSVADAYEAMTSDRPYRAAMRRAEAVDNLRRAAGTQFDPRVVDALIEATEHWASGPDVRLPGPAGWRLATPDGSRPADL